MNLVCAIFPLLFFFGKISGLEKNACKRFEDYPVAFMKSDCYHNPSVLADTHTLIKLNGYRGEKYSIVSDGYILTLHRIPAINNKKKKKPVFVLHGLYNSAAIWASFGNESLAFNLVEEGYDVWLGTYRGSTNSQKHQTFNVTSQEYWDFAIEDLKSDFSNQLEFVANNTKEHGKITCIVYSFGGTISLFHAADYPNRTAELVDGIIAFAPVLYLDHVTSVQYLTRIKNTILSVEAKLGIYGLFYHENSHYLITELCKYNTKLCTDLLKMAYGNLNEHLKPENLLALVSHLCDGTSMQIVKHYFQISITKNLGQYNYGNDKNIKKYGSFNPPQYNLSQVQIPVYILYGKKDWLGNGIDNLRVYNEIGSTKKKIIPISKNYGYSHLDFTTSKAIREDLYMEMFRAMDEIMESTSDSD